MTKIKLIFKSIIVILLVVYTIIVDSSIFVNKINAIFTLLSSILFLYKSRGNYFLFLIAFFMLYSNYSIVMGEYLIGGELGVPLVEVKTVGIYGESIKMMLLLSSIIAVFYNYKKVEINDLVLHRKDNIILFIGIFIVLMYVLIFGVNRHQLSSYSVSITPLYEYSTILFLVAYFYSGKSKARKILLTLLMVAFILQDFYYGGRITALQLVFLFLTTLFITKINIKNIILGGSIGIFINSIVGAYRGSYSLNTVNLGDIFVELKNSYFVFETPVYAYYASATHVAANIYATLEERVSSLVHFVISIFMGTSNEISNVTRYVASNYFLNIGGGLLPTHFYFWLGIGGVILMSIILVVILNKFNNLGDNYQKLLAIIFVITVPRWYLYNPLSMFRPLFLFTIVYMTSKFINHILTARNKDGCGRVLID